MLFDFDPQKSASNKTKHGLDFTEAQVLWTGAILAASAAFRGEQRSMITGKILGKHWTAIVTHRPPVIRIISVRRARIDEIHRYEQRFKP